MTSNPRSKPQSIKLSLGALIVLGLWAGSLQVVQAIPQQQNPQQAAKYHAESVHDAKWHQAHPKAKVTPPSTKGWIKTLPHRYRVVKYHHQTYYFANKHYYQRSGAGYGIVKIPF